MKGPCSPNSQALDPLSVKHVASVSQARLGNFLKGWQPDDWR